MTDVLNMRMDDIEDVRPHKNNQPRVNPLNHYEVEAHGVTLVSTEDRAEAIRVYRESQDTDKKVVKLWNGRRYQYLPRVN